MLKNSLKQTIDNIIIYGGEDGDLEWTLAEIQEDASWEISSVIENYLEGLKKRIPKELKFGDIEPLKNSYYNQAIDELLRDIGEGVE